MGALEGRRIIVTGAAGSLGAAAAQAFVREGARVAALDGSREAGKRVAEGCGAVFRSHDASGDDLGAALDRAVADLCGLDVLAYLATPQGETPAEELGDTEWDRVFSVSLRAMRIANQAAFRHLQVRGGRIINYAAGAGLRGLRGQGHVAAEAGGRIGWTRTASQEWARHGILMNILAGGPYRDPDREAVPLLVFLAGEGATMNGQTFQPSAVDSSVLLDVLGALQGGSPCCL